MKKLAAAAAAIVLLTAIVLVALYAHADTETRPLDADARAGAPGQFIELSDGVTHYELAGPADGPVVILVHGFSVPYYIWDTTFAALTESGRRVLRYDLYGRGYSDRPRIRYDGALFERQIVELIEALELSQPLDVVGLSMGGAVTVRFIANQRQRVRRAVLIDPVHRSFGNTEMPRLVGNYVFAVMMLPDMAEGQLSDFVYPENYPTWVDQYRVQMQFEGFRQAIISTLYDFGPEDHFSWYSDVQALGVPVMLIWGEEDQTLPIAGADEIREVLDVVYLPVPDAGHLPHIERADIVNPAIIEFLGRSSIGQIGSTLHEQD